MSDKRELIVQFNAEETWLEKVDKLKPMIKERKAAVKQALALCRMLNDQILVVKKRVTSEIVEDLSTPVLNEVSKLLNEVCDPFHGTILERVVEMVHIANSRVQDASVDFKKLQKSLSKAKKMWSQGILVVSVDDMKELAKTRVRQITVLLNSVAARSSESRRWHP